MPGSNRPTLRLGWWTISLRCNGLDEMIANLKQRGISFKERQVDNQGLYQLFLIDPMA
jgi:hypothetical protein